MEHYAQRKHHLNMSMESYISMAPARWKQTHDDSLVNCATDMRNVYNRMNSVKQYYCLNNKDMRNYCSMTCLHMLMVFSLRTING